MQTYLLSLYVSLEQENAIRKLYLQRGWTFKTTDGNNQYVDTDEDSEPNNFDIALDSEEYERNKQDHVNNFASNSYNANKFHKIENSLSAFRYLSDGVGFSNYYARDGQNTEAVTKPKTSRPTTDAISATEEVKTAVKCNDLFSDSDDSDNSKSDKFKSDFFHLKDGYLKWAKEEQKDDTFENESVTVEDNGEVVQERHDKTALIRDSGVKRATETNPRKKKVLKKQRLVNTKTRKTQQSKLVKVKLKNPPSVKKDKESKGRRENLRDIKTKLSSKARKGRNDTIVADKQDQGQTKHESTSVIDREAIDCSKSDQENSDCSKSDRTLDTSKSDTETIDNSKNETNTLEAVDSDKKKEKGTSLPQEKIVVRKSTFDCPECGKNFANRRNLNSHMYSRTKSKSFKCDMCDFEAVTACLLRTHKKQKHPPQARFQCHLCARIVNSKSYLTVHLKVVHHVIEGKYDCQICGQKFQRPKRFASHLREHANESEKKCKICGKAFKTMANLKNHQRYHRERKYMCDFCGKRFSTTTKLRAHERTHTGNKPYQCTICDYKSTQNGNVRLHMKVHQKEETTGTAQIVSEAPCFTKVKQGAVPTSCTALTSGQQTEYKSVQAYIEPVIANTNIKSAHVYTEPAIANIKSAHVYSEPAIANIKSAHVYSEPAIANIKSAHVYSGPGIANNKSTQGYSEPSIADMKAAQLYTEPGITNMKATQAYKPVASNIKSEPKLHASATELGVNQTNSDSTKTLPSYAEYIDSAIRSSNVCPPDSLPNSFQNSLSKCLPNSLQNSLPNCSQNNYNGGQHLEITDVPMAAYTEIQSSNQSHYYNPISTNVSWPHHETTGEASYSQYHQSSYLSFEHAQNLAEVEQLKNSSSLPRITDLSKSIKRNKYQTLYASEHAEQVPVPMLSEVNNLHAQSSAPTGQFDSSQFTALPMYSNTQIEQYSENSQLPSTYSESSLYGMPGGIMESMTQAYSDHFDSDFSTTVQSMSQCHELQQT